MRATGQLVFKRESNGSVSRKWIGGRRVAISSGLVESLTSKRPYIGQVITMQDVNLRIVGIENTRNGQGYQDSFIAMRDGIIARIVWRYWRWLNDYAYKLFKWECKWIRGRQPNEGEVYPKWSIVGILIRPLI